MDEDSFLELLDLYMEMAEKQDEIIHRLGKIAARMAADAMLQQNDRQYGQQYPPAPGAPGAGAGRLGKDVAIVKEAMGQYMEMKAGLEP